MAQNVYRLFIFAGSALIVIGLLLFVIDKIGLPIGRLPGDIVIKKEKFSLYFPVTTCILASVVLSAIFYFFRR